MHERLYDEHAEWWQLLAPPEDYDELCAGFIAMLAHGSRQPIRQLLELGSGSGAIATHLPEALGVTLLDSSAAMLRCSQQLNPSRTHVQGDMREPNFDEAFDAVLLQDAVMYLTQPEDLKRTFESAFAALRPGGAFLVVPDITREFFHETTLHGEGEAPDGRAARMMEWHWDPDPADHTYQAEFSYILRDAEGRIESLHESHTLALFTVEEYTAMAIAAGFQATALPEGVFVPSGLPLLFQKP